MKKALLFPLQVSLCTLGYLYSSISITQAQVTTDGTTNTTVNSDGSGNFTIEQGDRAGNNLFHSFGDFSVPTNSSAFFNNAADIANIFSRVTGGNVSNIDGLIRANGSASLFLINPAGILFGNNARLDIGGSFLGTTADSILFEDGLFSATDLDNPPLLTVNAPIGLNFRDNPGDIVNRSFAQNDTGELVGLEVESGNNLSLIGGDIILEDTTLNLSGGQITIGGLASEGIVEINEDGSPNFPNGLDLGNVQLTNSTINVLASAEGSIFINANTLQLLENSTIAAGISEGTDFNPAEPGNIEITVNTLELQNQSVIDISTFGQGNTGNVLINGSMISLDDSSISNEVGESGIGNSGDIEIFTNSLSLFNGSQIFTVSSGEGNSGDILIDSENDITLRGINEEGFSSLIATAVNPGGTGNSGNIIIDTPNVSILNGGQLFTGSFGLGDTGNLIIDAQSLRIDAGRISTFTSEGAIGNAGDINVTAEAFSLINDSVLDSGTFGEGNAGNINIDVFNITLDDAEINSQVSETAVGDGGNITIRSENFDLFGDSSLFTSTSGMGNAGNVTINTSDFIALQGTDTTDTTGSLSIFTSVNQNAEGDAGNINVTAGAFALTDGASLDSSTFGMGEAGNITINVADAIFLDNDSRVSSTVGQTGQGNGGNVELVSSSLSLSDGAQIITSVFGTGNAGSIQIDTEELSLNDNAQLNAAVFGQGNAGNIEIIAVGNIVLNQSNIFSQVNSDGIGNGGEILIDTNNFLLLGGSQIVTSISGSGNGGSINIDANTINISGFNSQDNSSGLFANSTPDSLGNAGSITVNSSEFKITNSGTITVNSEGMGSGGNVNIQSESLELDNNASISSTSFFGSGGNANIQLEEDLILRNNSNITAGAFGEATGGNVSIDSRFIIAFPSEVPVDGNDIIAEAGQSGGSINIFAQDVFGMSIRQAVPGNQTNDISAANTTEVLNLSPQIITELQTPPPIIDSQLTTEQACRANREQLAQGSLTVEGKGGIPPEPGLPLNSQNIFINGEINSNSTIPEPIETSQGKIQPARGIKVTESGKIILTAYRTNNSGERTPEIRRNCGQV